MLSVDAKLEAEVVQGIPLGRKGRPDEFRGVMTWLASDASSFCTGSECVALFVHVCQVACRFSFNCFIHSILMTGGATARAA